MSFGLDERDQMVLKRGKVITAERVELLEINIADVQTVKSTLKPRRQVAIMMRLQRSQS